MASKLLSAVLLVGLSVVLGQVVTGPRTPFTHSSNARFAAAPVHTLGRIDTAPLLAEDLVSTEKSFRFAASVPADISLATHGEWTNVAGGRLWRLTVRSAGALSLSLVFSHFSLPAGAHFWVYNENDVLGAYTIKNVKENGQFSTQPISGESMTLEYFEPTLLGAAHAVMNVSSVAHGYRPILKDYHDSGSCNVNVLCEMGDNWRNQIRGVSMIMMADGTRLCSGSMINNARGDGRQLYLTANHCCAYSPTNWIFMFNYFSPVCDYAKEQDGDTSNTVQGSKKLAAASYSDFCLLELTETIPKEYNVYLNGFNAVEEIPKNPWCIHHPSADVKKISNSLYEVKSSGYGTATGDSHWWVTQYTNGTTEPGSSGSPLFDSNQRIIGQLHGGEAACSYNYNDYYGKVSQSWSHDATNKLQPYLDPDNKGVKTVDGRDLY